MLKWELVRFQTKFGITSKFVRVSRVWSYVNGRVLGHFRIFGHNQVVLQSRPSITLLAELQHHELNILINKPLDVTNLEELHVAFSFL